MPDVNGYIFDKIIEHSAYVQHYSELEAAAIAEGLALGRAELGKAVAEAIHAGKGKKRAGLVKKLNEIKAMAAAAAAGVAGAAGSAADALAAAEAKLAAGILSDVMPVGVTVSAPTYDQVLAAMKDEPLTFGGPTPSEAFKVFGDDFAAQVANKVRAGAITGQTTDEVVRAILGIPGVKAGGVVGAARVRARRLARTVLQHYADGARDETFKRNAEIMAGEQWSATLDTRTCPVCGPMDGQVFKLGEGPRPPYHWNCRCCRIPYTKSWSELGAKFDPGRFSPIQRASMDGAVPASMTWNQWLAKKEAEAPGFAKPILGAGRYELYKAGKWAPGAFVATDSPMTLAELRAALDIKPDPKKQAAMDAVEAAKAKAAAEAEAAESKAKLEQEYAAKRASDKAKLAALAEEKRADEAAKIHAESDSGVRGAKAFGDTLTATDRRMGGSTGARYYKGADGSGWIVKTYHGNAIQAQNEYVAAKLYKTLGVRVPDVRMVEIDGQLGIASRDLGAGYEIIGSKLVAAAQKSSFIRRGYVADAYLANWDVAGLKFDNIMAKVSGNKKLADAVRIDTGGSLLFRAQGSLKGAAFGASVKELDTLLDPSINANTARLFGSLTKKEIRAQMDSLLSMDFMEVRRAIIRSGMDQGTAQLLESTLRQRFDDILVRRDALDASIKADARAARGMKGSAGIKDGTIGGLPYRYGAPGKVYSHSDSDLVDAELKRVYPTLKADERRALSRYTGSGYSTINTSAYKHGINYAELDAGIEALPRIDCTLFRGVGDGGSLAANFDKFKTGEWSYVHMSAYTSTSIRAGSFGWDAPFKLVIRQHGKQSGGWIGPYSEHRSEDEYLLGRNTVYRVAGWTERGERRTLVLEEVDPGDIAAAGQEPPRQYDSLEEIVREHSDSIFRPKNPY